jgi:hypothetical protein
MQLAILSRGYVVSRAIHALARLGVPDFMEEQPLPAEQIATQAKIDVIMLERLLNFLSDYGLFTKEGHSYGLTALSKPMRTNDPHSVRDVLNMVDENWWMAFAHLDKSLQDGKPAFDHQHGMDFFSFLGQKPERQSNFDRGMAKLSNYDDHAIANALDLQQIKRLVDVGGGRGGLVKEIAKIHPGIELTLFDSPQVISQLNPEDFPEQVNLVAGDFFHTLPAAEGYLFKGVLHDFNDRMMQDILRNCHQQMAAQSTLFIAEQVIPNTNTPHPNKTMDIVMMVLLGGRQRTLADWREIVEPIGFHLHAVLETASIFTVLEFQKL